MPEGARLHQEEIGSEIEVRIPVDPSVAFFRYRSVMHEEHRVVNDLTGRSRRSRSRYVRDVHLRPAPCDDALPR